MTKREKVLLILFIAIVLVTVFLMTFLPSLSDLRIANKGIATYTQALLKLPDIVSSDNAQMHTEQKTGREKQVLTVTEIAENILMQLQKQNIKPKKYQITGSGTAQLVEFSFLCPAYDFCRFLYTIAAEDQWYTIKSLSVKPESQGVSVVMRACAEPFYTASASLPSPSVLTQLFTVHNPDPPVQSDVKPEAAATPVPAEILKGDSLFKPIGYIADTNGISYLYIKNNQSARIYRLAPNEIIEDSKERYVFKIEETVYSLSKKKE